MRCDACADVTLEQQVIVVCYVIKGLFDRGEEPGRYEERDTPVSTRSVSLCKAHERQLLRPLERLAHVVEFG